MADPTPQSSGLEIERLQEIAERAAKVAPGEWESDRVESEDGNGKFYAYEVTCARPYYGKPWSSIVDTQNSENACISTEYDEDGAASWDEHGRLVCEHIAALDPPTVLTLLTRLQSLEDENARLLGEVENAEIEEAFDEAARARDEAGFLGTPADCIRYLDAEVLALRDQLTASWRCFQCDEVFTDKGAAEGHFGRWPHHSPACMAGETFQTLKTAYNALEGDFYRQKEARQAAEAALALAREGLKKNAATLEWTIRRCIEWDKAHGELDHAITDTRDLLSTLDGEVKS